MGLRIHHETAPSARLHERAGRRGAFLSIKALAGSAIICAFSCLGTLTARADDATSLLTKHKAFAGWQFGDAQMKTLEMTQTFTRGDTVEVTQRIRRIGAFYRVDSHNTKAGTDSSAGFTGNLFWYSNENGFTVPIIGDPAKSSLAEDLFFTDAVAQLPWTIVRTERRWDKSYAVVRVEQAASFPLELYVDPDTGAYGGAVIDPKGDNEEAIHVLDYRQIGDKHFISRWKFESSKRTVTISDIKLGVQVTAQDLHPPPQTAHLDFTNPAPFPIRLTRDRIVMTAKVNGVKGDFLFDSGAASIFLSGDFARRAGLKATGHSEARTLHGTEKIDAGKAATLEVGGNVLHDVHVYFGAGQVDMEGPDGLLGFDLVAAAFVTLDFEKSTLQFQDPTALDVASVPGVRIGVDLSDGTPTTLMYVQRKTTTVNATLDTGNPRFVLISDDLVNKYGLHMTAAGVLGGCGLLDDMSIGPIVYDKPNACTFSFGGVHDALLGYDFLKRFAKVYFDYPRAAMILAPRAK